MDIHQIHEKQEAMIKETAEFLSKSVPTSKVPRLAVICGSGLQHLSQAIQDPTVLEYKQIPNFVTNTVVGHAGKLVFGFLSGVPTVCMVGRFHFYEGHSMFQVTFPIRVFQAMTKNRLETLIVTNASGALNPNFNVGDIMIIRDHISMPGLAGNNPLVGVNFDKHGPRFPAMNDAYDTEYGKLVPLAAKRLNLVSGDGANSSFIREGTYVMVSGPSYETKAEASMLRMMGADAVGMSTVPEVVAARHGGVTRVLGLALITNKVITKENEHNAGMVKPSHEEVLAASAARAKDMQALVAQIVELIDQGNKN